MAIGLAPKTPLDVIEPAAATLVALVGRYAVTPDARHCGHCSWLRK
ncbi:hypothetical protein [Mycolicibacterium chlorophenolicum]|uniref:Uncharacterized protein n=1 Tax=Mycolicibacterium chlorophenolicum TaxID=37916 RepID=A0A0J6VQQ4_9MYCO|nr:hypothetical protein [Mycolicibacterium chlorophenolicum]KMO72494.1 hypothetical protein MCHLDSM_03977 [Mycolicibacterium chlorophenolicum]